MRSSQPTQPTSSHITAAMLVFTAAGVLLRVQRHLWSLLSEQHRLSVEEGRLHGAAGMADVASGEIQSVASLVEMVSRGGEGQ